MHNRLLHTGDKFRKKYKRIDGFEFYGQMLDIPDTARVSNFLSARRYLRVSPNCAIAPSDVVVINNQKYIVGEHGVGFYIDPIYKHYKLFEVDRSAVWKSLSKVLNPITGVEEGSREAQEDVVYLSVQPKGSIEDSMHIQQQTFVVICNAAVNRNDIVDNKIVTKVDYVLGTYLLEMKEQ